MLFNSYGYFLFLLLVVPACRLTAGRLRLRILTLASVAFYAMWRIDFTFLMLFSALVDFVAALRIGASGSPSRRRAWLVASLSIQLGLLAFFKYTYFTADTVRAAAGALGHPLPSLQELGVTIILPLGISFYTFQTMSYVIDVYRGVAAPIREVDRYVAFVCFWPQLIAGPILRADELAGQLVTPHPVGPASDAYGLGRLLVGLFKKVVLADNLAGWVDPIFAAPPSSLAATDVWAGGILFGFQIYFDFSGYSDMAVGAARLMGVGIPENFHWPYLATSPRDFWKRWHISLSSWVRDYLYLPLTGQAYRVRAGEIRSEGGLAVAAREGENRRTGALFLTWFLMGLWHGAGWNYAAWGLYHAAWIWIYRRFGALQRLADRRPGPAWALAFPVAMAGWIPFRAQSLEQAAALFGRLADPRNYDLSARTVYGPVYLAGLLLIAGTPAAGRLRRLWDSGKGPGWLRAAVVGAGTAAMTVLVLIYLKPVKQFIYFQF